MTARIAALKAITSEMRLVKSASLNADNGHGIAHYREHPATVKAKLVNGKRMWEGEATVLMQYVEKRRFGRATRDYTRYVVEKDGRRYTPLEELLESVTETEQVAPLPDLQPAQAVSGKFRLLDLFCGAGGSAKGYQQAGFHVTGVDYNPQPRYAGDVFIQADALEYVAAHGHEYDAIHASPPCQRYSEQTAIEHREKHPDLIPQTRTLLQASGKPYVIENVPGARKRLIDPIKLCGSMFGLRVFRHRYFELGNGFDINDFQIPACRHDFEPVYMTGSTGSGRSPKGTRKHFTVAETQEASGCHWMTIAELDEAIPPAYTAFIGKYLLAEVERRAAQQNDTVAGNVVALPARGKTRKRGAGEPYVETYYTYRGGKKYGPYYRERRWNPETKKREFVRCLKGKAA